MHLCETLRRQRLHFEGDELRLLEKNMQRNMFMAHKEAILLAMLGDEDAAVRAEAVEMIRAVRQRSTSSAEQQIRAYKAPTVNTSAENFRELIDLPAIMECGNDLEPPHTRALSDTELAKFKQQPLVTGVPLHTQSTERAVKLTTEAASAISGTERQDGAALNKRAYRRRHPGQVTKKWRQE